MENLGWFIIALALALILGAMSLAWRSFSRPPRVRSPELKELDELYFEGEIKRDEYERRKAELERKGRADVPH